jgi:hypothetical protein
VNARNRRRLPRRVLLLLCASAFLAARAALLTRQGPWADEYFSLAMATGHSLEHPAAVANPARGDFVEAAAAAPPAEYARYLEHDDPPAGIGRVLRAVELSDTSPPLYYLLLWAWTRAFGTSDGALRALSVVFALAALPLVARIARHAAGRAAAAPACVLFTLLPASVWFSTEGRMYSLLWLEAAGLAATTGELARRGPFGSARWLWAAWVAAAAAGLFTHYAFVFVLGAVLVASAWQPRRIQRGHLALAALAAVLLVLPWYVRLPEAASRWRVTDYWLEVRPAGFVRAAAVGELLWSLFSIRGVWGVAREHDLVHATVVAALAGLAAWRLRGRWFAARRLLPWLWLLSAWLGPVVLDALQGTYMTAVPRYALAGLPAAVVLLAASLAALSPRVRLALLALLVATSLVGVRRALLDRARIGEPFREVARKLADSIGPDVLVVVHSIPSGVAGLARELERTGVQGRQADVLSWVTQLGARRAPDDLLAAARGRSRIVHVSIHPVGARADAEEWLKEHARRVQTIRIDAARAIVFEPDQGGVF